MTRSQCTARWLTRRCIKGFTLGDRATSRKHPSRPHWKYAPIHRWRLYQIAHPKEGQHLRGLVFENGKVPPIEVSALSRPRAFSIRCTENSILAPRIHGEVLKFGFEVAQSSVAKYMVKRCRPPSQGWRLFRERQILDRRRGPPMNASLHRKARLPFLKPDLAPNPIFARHSYDCEGSELSVP